MSIEIVLYVESKTRAFSLVFADCFDKLIFLGPQFASLWNKEILDF